jgi:hypothetical protein
MMAAPNLSLIMDSIIDAEFETVLPAKRSEPPSPRVVSEFPAPVISTDGLALLREKGPARPESDQPEQLTPAFLFFTFIAAVAVFWVSGGHALLY